MCEGEVHTISLLLRVGVCVRVGERVAVLLLCVCVCGGVGKNSKFTFITFWEREGETGLLRVLLFVTTLVAEFINTLMALP